MSVEEEIERVVPLIERVAGELGALVSVDTYKPAVAQRRDRRRRGDRQRRQRPARPGAGRGLRRDGRRARLMHTARRAPSERLQDPDLYDDVTAEVLAFLRERIELALGAGVRVEQLIVDPGPDFAKTPAQTIELLRDSSACTSSAGRC